jgi:hypothetical protein
MDSNSNNSKWRRPTDSRGEEVTRKEELKNKYDENE